MLELRSKLVSILLSKEELEKAAMEYVLTRIDETSLESTVNVSAISSKVEILSSGCVTCKVILEDKNDRVRER